MLTEFFIFGTLWFWILLGVVGLIITSLIEHGDEGGDTNGTGATLTLIGFTVVYYLMGSSEHVINLFHYIVNHPLTILGYLGGYYLVGLVWSIVKWYFYLKFKAAELSERIDTYSHTVGSISDSELRPTASKKKGTIMSWMTYWPFSMVWTMLHKFVREAFQYIFIQFEGVYNKISNSVFADVNAKYEAKLAERKAKKDEQKTN